MNFDLNTSHLTQVTRIRDSNVKVTIIILLGKKINENLWDQRLET